MVVRHDDLLGVVLTNYLNNIWLSLLASESFLSVIDVDDPQKLKVELKCATFTLRFCSNNRISP